MVPKQKQNKILNKNAIIRTGYSIGAKVLAVHVTNLGLIPGTMYVTQALPG